MRANYFKLGLFVVVSVGLFLAGVTVLGAGAMFKKTFKAETYFEESVQGLTIGSDIKYQGIKVGRITKISTWAKLYDPDAFRDPNSSSYGMGIVVQLAFEADALPHATEDEFVDFILRASQGGLRVQKASSGITGPAFLSLVYVDPQENAAVAIDWEPRLTYIPWTPSTTKELMESIQTISQSLEKVKFDEISEQISTLIDDVDAIIKSIDVTQITNDATALLEELRASNQRLQDILNNPDIDTTMASLAATMGNVESIVGTGDGDLGTFVADLPQISARLKTTIDDIDALVADPQIKEIIANIDTLSADAGPALIDVQRAVRRIDRLVATQEVSFDEAMRELTAALRNLNSLSEDAKRNPSRMLFGDPPPKTKPGGTP